MEALNLGNILSLIVHFSKFNDNVKIVPITFIYYCFLIEISLIAKFHSETLSLRVL